MKYFNRFKKSGLLGYSLIAGVFLVITNLFYLVFYNLNIPSKHYTGINIFDFTDKFVYLSMAKQGSQGLLMMFNLYTSEPQKGLVFSPHWWLIGATARLTSLDLSLVMNLYRIFFATIFFVMVFLWLKKLFPQRKHMYGAAILLFGAGTLGWADVLIRQAAGRAYVLANAHWAYDVVDTELSVFRNLQGSPLAIISQMATLGLLYLFVVWSGRWLWGRALLWGGVLFIFLLIHPFDGLIIAGVLTVWCCWMWQQTKNQSIFRYWLVMATGCLAAAGYYVLSWQVDPVLAGWKAQNITLSPPVYQLLFALWPYFGLAVIGSIVVGRYYKNDPWWRLILIWGWIVWIIAYIPDQFNRRALNGWMIPLALLSYLGLVAIARSKIGVIWGRTVAICLVTILVGGSLYGMYFQFYFLPKILKNEVLFMPDDLSRLFVMAEQTIPPRSIVLASDMNLSVMTPAYTGLRTFVGHYIQTIDYKRKEREAEKFWSDAPLVWRHEFLQKNNINYLLVKHSQFVGLDIGIWLPQLTVSPALFTSDRYDLYQVRDFAPATTSDQAIEPITN